MLTVKQFFRVLACSSTLVVVTACGGGGGGGGSAAPSGAASAPLPSPAPSTSAPTDSTRLTDNVAPPGASFDNFQDARVRVPVSQVDFTGATVFVKLNRADGELLFIGPAARGRDFTVPIQLPAGETVLYYEIFSDSRLDQIIFGEIRL